VRNWKRWRLAAEEVKMSGTALDMILDIRGDWAAGFAVRVA